MKTNQTSITSKQKEEEKQFYKCFKQLIINISHDKMWMQLNKGNLKRETESLFIAAQNSATRTNHIKTKIDKTQQKQQM